MKNSCIFLFVFLSSLMVAQYKYKDYNNILNSSNIYELDAFLRDANPKDARRNFVKSKLINLIDEYIKNAHPVDQRIKDLQKMRFILMNKGSTKVTFEEMKANIKEKQIQDYKNKLKQFHNKNIEFENDQIVKTSNEANPQNIGFNSQTLDSKPLDKIRNNESKINNNEFDQLMNVSSDKKKEEMIKVLNTLLNKDEGSVETTVMIKNESNCDIVVELNGENNYKIPVPKNDENTIVVMKGDYSFSGIVCGAEYISNKKVDNGIILTLGNP